MGTSAACLTLPTALQVQETVNSLSGINRRLPPSGHYINTYKHSTDIRVRWTRRTPRTINTFTQTASHNGRPGARCLPWYPTCLFGEYVRGGLKFVWFLWQLIRICLEYVQTPYNIQPTDDPQTFFRLLNHYP